jgi:tRNA(Ile)-lysidine synthase
VSPDVAVLLSRCRFPAAGTPVTCAVSGGADSLALLVLATAAGCDVTAVHVDHGLRPGSAAEADHVATVASSVGAAFRACRVVVAPGANLEARARAARYAALPPGVCTGHTADDQAETVLLHLLRGGGLAGFAAMRTGVQRPLLSLRRHETRALCGALGLQPVDDPMNADPRFARVRVRHEVLPLLGDVARRDVAPLLARNAELAADALDALDAVVGAVDAADVHALRALPRPLARWALRRWLTAQTGSDHAPDAAAVDRVLAVVDGTVRAAEIVGGWRVARTENRLRIEPVTA